MIENSILSDRRLDEKLSLSKSGYTNVCNECKAIIAANEYIWYNTFKRTVRHKKCPVINHDVQEE